MSDNYRLMLITRPLAARDEYVAAGWAVVLETRIRQGTMLGIPHQGVRLIDAVVLARPREVDLREGS